MANFLIDAQVLAEFSNLTSEVSDPLSPKNISHFRHNHPNFVPESWWSPEEDSRYSWKMAHEYVREAWKEKFPLETCVRLVAFGPREKVAPYQQAIMYLFANRWRAKFCLRCGNRFAANAPKSIYCSDACFQSTRKDSKKAWWNEHGQQWRDSRTKKSPSGKSSKSKRSK
jgi:hypothetical protein